MPKEFPQFSVVNLITGKVPRLTDVPRWSIVPRTVEETVAEHVGMVAIFSLFIAGEIQRRGGRVMIGPLLTAALLHDLEEGITGDLDRNFKLDLRLRGGAQAVRRSAKVAMAGILEDVWPEKEDEPSKAIRDIFFASWCDAKADTLEGRIVAFADFLSALMFAHKQVQMGNRLFAQRIPPMTGYLASFADDPDIGDMALDLCPIVGSIEAAGGRSGGDVFKAIDPEQKRWKTGEARVTPFRGGEP